MPQSIRKLTVMFISLHAAVGFLSAAGSAEVFGTAVEPGVDPVTLNPDGIDVSGFGALAGIIAIAQVVLNTLSGLLASFTLIPTLLINLGIPGFIVFSFYAPLTTVVALDLLAIIRGTDF